MLVEFTVGNYRSFYTPVRLSMVAVDSVTEHQGVEGAQNNTLLAMHDSMRLLATSVLYGANGSGKSNVMQAMAFFRGFILNSFDRTGTELIPINCFGFHILAHTQPSLFEMIFIIDERRYRYGFEVDNEKVHSEWLFCLQTSEQEQEILLFSRTFQDIAVSQEHLKEAQGLEKRTRANALFLSTLEQFNVEEASKILRWFFTKFMVGSTLNVGKLQQEAIELFRDDNEFKNFTQGFLGAFKLGFETIELKNNNNDNKVQMLWTVHKVFNEEWNTIPSAEARLDFSAQSEGTQKLFVLSALLYNVLNKGCVVIVDELDSSFHPLLTLEIVKLFHRQSKNKSQMIFAVHDTNLLRSDIFRHDQIWFTEKKETGETDLYSLVEFKINQAEYVYGDATALEKDYLYGKYGAIPFLGNLQQFIHEFLGENAHAQ
jgi:AAA15 family ATPase/GTPase